MSSYAEMRSRMRELTHVAVALAAALLSAGVCATEIEPPEDAGLSVGRVAPDFSLSGQDGKQVSLASLLKKGPVAVVFHRSADWCVYCKLQMVQLERHLKEIEAAGGQVVAISYDPVEKLRNFADRSKITFPTAFGRGQQDHRCLRRPLPGCPAKV